VVAGIGTDPLLYIQQPDSLCTQILKARYFPNGDVLSATLLKVFHIPGEAYCMVLIW
jgi:hypothetical protein